MRKTTSPTRKSSRKTIRRRIQRTGTHADIAQFKIKSRTRNDGTEWHPHVDSNGNKWCDCPGFRGHGHCWHTDRALENLVRHGELDPEQVGGCVRCHDHSADSYFGLADDNGNPLPGVICGRCVGELSSVGPMDE